MKKLTRGRQKRTIQSDDAPRKIAWTREEEIALCKGWVYVSENISVGNTMKDAGFWCEVLQYMKSKTKQLKESGASDEDYYARALVDYEVETETTFKLRSKRYKSSGSSSFNIEFVKASINLNAKVGDDEEDEVKEIQRPIGKDKAKDVAKKRVESIEIVKYK
nr:hypothetical protein [Tanacetum cinerariifolium]GEZ97119.1 hypothetical protein [Tanacetum cinerariifolium]GFA03984.1 hypothetical protein [Tanacetum cinerariifolium]